MDFVVYPDPALSRAAALRKPDSTMREVGARLLAAAKSVDAYGLAAAHLGLDEPLIVISVADDKSQRDYRILYSPEITQMSAETATGLEGSVSLPGIEVPVSRAIWVDIAYFDGGEARHVERFEGFVGRVAQHEVDQMNGMFFLRRVSPVKRDIALRKFQKSMRT